MHKKWLFHRASSLYNITRYVILFRKILSFCKILVKIFENFLL
ncbi:hypothetical protein CLOSYM_03152 [[Clostridium] symbiosum ATCC 14940]|uniref:Uncharacterized protein n=1 Tax=[Clostridium] symbiosum ATCC 14940 TaxID=411472 RepID=A0ABC9TVH7_CLOSY|nr:hypothetical protein CLOSYM_03152 [[Clostridium] symbiosum ATCC 14940]